LNSLYRTGHEGYQQTKSCRSSASGKVITLAICYMVWILSVGSNIYIYISVFIPPPSIPWAEENIFR
jgi:hypothetical protein